MRINCESLSSFSDIERLSLPYNSEALNSSAGTMESSLMDPSGFSLIAPFHFSLYFW